MASILEKIGIRCFLVAIPGHMYMAYSRTGKTQPIAGDIQYVETTLIGSKDMKEFLETKMIRIKAFIGIRAARE